MSESCLKFVVETRFQKWNLVPDKELLSISNWDVFLILSLEIFDTKSANKICSKKDKEIKVSPLMPIRVKSGDIFCFFNSKNLGLDPTSTSPGI